MPMRACRIDANQHDIVKVFRRCGFSVAHTYMVGFGFPDLVVALGNVTALIEVKDGSKEPARRALTPDEKKFHAGWSGLLYVVESDGDALAVVDDLRARAKG